MGKNRVRTSVFGATAAIATALSGFTRSAIANPSALPFIPPVDAVIAGHFDAPETAYGSGHRGIDYAVAPGTRVRAVGPGTVSFAGPVAGNLAVTIDHGSGLETTYSILSKIEVRKGDTVHEGRFIGRTLQAHPNEREGLHFGVKVDGDYVDPIGYLGPIDVSGAIHLAPLVEDASPISELTPPDARARVFVEQDPRCVTPAVPRADPPPPNDNVAIAVAGVGSRTKGETNAQLFKESSGPWTLGYPEERIYRFSYQGTAGPRLHDPYEATDTYRDIRSSALKLRRLLVLVHRRHPEAAVDLFAHSQGGLVARAALELGARAYDSRLPRVEHLVTYGSPHSGAPLAGTVDALRSETIVGPALIEWVSRRSERGSVPDPLAPSVAQMAPDSSFLADLSVRDVTFGTKVLALAMPHDAVVPAHRALYPGKQSRILEPEGFDGHDSVTASPQARALAYSFLRGRAEACPSGWDVGGLGLGLALERLEAGLVGAWDLVETVALRVPARLARWWAIGGVLNLADDVLRAGVSAGRRAAPGLARLGLGRAAEVLLPGGGRVVSWLLRI
ncbi:MAG: peptidoglycan DD-metalloendopeptidase family protein [Actinomycetota bacterium]|nr:peptidoglycan DD-metalloendopeptidase family protein [Actinomycetota bacterium]